MVKQGHINFNISYMKQLFRKIIQPANTDYAILLLRVGASSLMLTHGIPKLMQFFSGEPIAFASVMGMSMTLSLALAVFAEAFCSVLVLFGIGTRLATIPLIITMLTAVFIIHANDPFANKEMALLYAIIFTVLFLTGGGKYSADHLISKKLAKKNLH